MEWIETLKWYQLCAAFGLLFLIMAFISGIIFRSTKYKGDTKDIGVAFWVSLFCVVICAIAFVVFITLNL